MLLVRALHRRRDVEQHEEHKDGRRRNVLHHGYFCTGKRICSNSVLKKGMDRLNYSMYRPVRYVSKPIHLVSKPIHPRPQ